LDAGGRQLLFQYWQGSSFIFDFSALIGRTAGN